LALWEESWREIFILSAAELQMPLDVHGLLANAGLGIDNTPSAHLIQLMNEMRALQEIIAKFKQAQVDSTEFTCLKAIALFKTSKHTLYSHRQSLKVTLLSGFKMTTTF
jgi:hypothetical protein